MIAKLSRAIVAPPRVQSAKSLVLGVVLIVLAAGVLLYSDLGSRRRAGTDASRPLRIALVQQASLPALDEGVKGVIEALQERGYVHGGRLQIRQYNAHGDMPTANAIASEVTSSDYDLIISASTASLQTIANANRFARPPRKHVFGLTSDPYGAGVGVSRENHLDHPPYMTGLGSMAPVEDAFRLARELKPDLKRVGLIWNPAEANSVATTTLGRKITKELGIELVEANADSATAAGEAAASVLSRGIEALWVSPDVTVVTAIDVLLAAAKRARVPVFTSLPGYAEKGALFDLGADYFGIGYVQGELAADVLDGRDPATVPVENLMPVKLHVNRLALDGLTGTWQIPASIPQRADVLFDASGRHAKPEAPKPLTRKKTVDLIEYVDTLNAELAREGVMDGLAQSGLVLGKDFDLRRHVAQGDIATLSSIIDNTLTQGTDLMITISTPTLQTALARGRGTSVVFTMVSNPFIVKAGKTDTDHLPFVTGSYLDQPVKEMIEALRQFRPQVRRIGTLYSPAELNAVFNKEQLETAAKAAGLTFEAVPVTNSSEVIEGALSLAHKIDVLTQIADNTVASSFPALMEAARRARLPVTAYSPAFADMGPIVVLARDYRDNGVASGKMAARVLRGEPPDKIPFFSVPTLSYIVNLKTANAHNVQLSPELMAKATRVIR